MPAEIDLNATDVELETAGAETIQDMRSDLATIRGPFARFQAAAHIVDSLRSAGVDVPEAARAQLREHAAMAGRKIARAEWVHADTLERAEWPIAAEPFNRTLADPTDVPDGVQLSADGPEPEAPEPDASEGSEPRGNARDLPRADVSGYPAGGREAYEARQDRDPDVPDDNRPPAAGRENYERRQN